MKMNTISASRRVVCGLLGAFSLAGLVRADPSPVNPRLTVGIDATWVVSRRFYVDGRAQYLKVNISNLDGSLGIYEFDVLYRYRPNVSFAVGYSDFTADITSSKRSQAGVFNFSTKGPEMFFRIAF